MKHWGFLASQAYDIWSTFSYPNLQKILNYLFLKDEPVASFLTSSSQEKYYIFLICSQEKHIHFQEKSQEKSG